MGAVGSSFNTSEIAWSAFGSQSPVDGAVAVGFVHSHPNGSTLSGQGQFVIDPFPGVSEIFESTGGRGDLGLAWARGYRYAYASSGPSLHGWSQSRFLSGFDREMGNIGRAYLNTGQYCLQGNCR